VHGEVDRIAADRLQRHVVQRHLAHTIAVAGRNAIGALVDGREAEVLQDRHALGELHGRAEPIHRCMHPAWGLAVEVDGHRPIRVEPLDALDVD
jgi:hypothetical protein